MKRPLCMFCVLCFLVCGFEGYGNVLVYVLMECALFRWFQIDCCFRTELFV